MYRLKGCPRCRGDLGFCVDIYGFYWTCFQCGRDIYLPADK